MREEREKSDRAIADGRDQVENIADAVLRHARIEADAVLHVARDKADRVLREGDGSAAAVRAVEQERAAEDAALREDRAAADETLEFERVETVRLLARLLPEEREATDSHLHAERVRSDGALANRDDFLGLVAHDLRDLLSGVALSAAIIAKKVADTDQRDPVAPEIARIQRHTARATRLLSDLVDVASIDAGRLAIHPAAGDLSALIAEVADEFSASAAAKGIDIAVDDAGAVPGDFDHARLFQVLGNLVGNAIKFSPRGSRIVLRGRRVGDQLQCAVQDQGPGIPAEHIEAVFQRFAQLKANDRRGLGLGLFIAQRIVDGHGGRIWAESTPGQGTSVLFSIPTAFAA
ncbi:MAG TPA: HAMP domain-containing sensor histidine kinase [Vicinamibacterales bacterium]|nr:HAMP domain-containing sensor histidine kinase [Vicinamibacterales bacterium]